MVQAWLGDSWDTGHATDNYPYPVDQSAIASGVTTGGGMSHSGSPLGVGARG